ncbi:MAG: glycine betaine ABC transporter substrate-binding protein [Bacteroidota bacterium]
MKRILFVVIFCLALCDSNAQKVIRVGSKHFTEGYILSEMLAQLLESKGFVVERKFNLGGTLVCFEALRKGEIDIYPEYTGTITREILRGKINELNKLGLSISKPYGFNNTYSLVVKSGLKSISELKDHPELKAGISYEFLKRQDGWEALANTYDLPQKPTALEHGLAYEALLNGKIDITDCYSTDGEISVNNLIILKDDKNFFPRYEAVSFYRSDLNKDAIEVIDQLTGKISEGDMSKMNADAVYGKKSFETIAKEFLGTKSEKTNNDLLNKILQHLYLTFTALALAIIVALPLGTWLSFKPGVSNFFLYVAGLLQTIPSIALLAIMIPVFGIGSLPAIVALLVYAVLPILRNTITGLRGIDPLLKEAAATLGMSRMQKLRYVSLPLAAPSILAGIRTAAVINVGTATLAAFIGAGGLGEYIVTGLALNNTQMILKGAIPAAILALAIELVFELIERRLTPAHLRKK